MITSHHNHGTGYIVLDVPYPPELPEQITVYGQTLFRKSELHVSLMALKHLVPLINAANHTVSEEDLVQDFLNYQAEHDLSTFHSTHTYRYVTRKERKTVVGMVDVPNIDGLFDSLQRKYATAIPTQPTHVTLYTLQPEMGIGILSQEELAADSVAIDIPELTF